MSSGEPQPRLRIIGPGRAGLSFARALAGAGWTVTGVLGRTTTSRPRRDGGRPAASSPPPTAPSPVSPPPSTPVAGTVVAHLAGSLGTGVLAPHPRRAAIHPLLPLPDPVTGAARLPGAWFAVAGDPMAARGRRRPRRADRSRSPTRTGPPYHAAATLASNHLVALLGQVERVAAGAGVPLAAYLDLARAALADVAARGPAAALTGPVARGDWQPSTAIWPPSPPRTGRVPGHGGTGGPAGRRRLPAPLRRSRPCTRAGPVPPASRPCPHRRSRALAVPAMTVTVLPSGRPSARPSTPSGPPAAPSGWSRPWAPCTPATPR